MEYQKQIRFEFFKVCYWNSLTDREVTLLPPSSYGAAIDFIIFSDHPEKELYIKMVYMKPSDVKKGRLV